VTKQDIWRLDVPVKHRRNSTVQVVEHLKKSHREFLEFLPAQHWSGGQTLLQRRTFNELLDDIECPRGVLFLKEVKDPRNRRVVQPGEHRRFPFEQLKILPVLQVLEAELLDRYSATVTKVVAEQSTG
jgi:hypothetical protein